MILFNLLVPCIVSCLDSRAYSSLKNPQPIGISESILRKIAARKRQPYEIAIYSRPMYSEYAEIDKASFCVIFGLFYQTIHPIGSLLHRFDFEFKRLSRFMVMSMQISTIAIICSIIYAPSDYRSGQIYSPNRTLMLDYDDCVTASWIGAVLSILTLPLSHCLTLCCRSRLMIVKNDDEEGHAKKKVEDRANKQYEGGE